MTGIVRGLLGKKSKAEGILQTFRPSGFSSPGLSGSFSGNNFSVRRGAEVQGNVDRLVSASDQTISDLRGVRADVRPGFGRLTESRVRGIRTAGARVVGNLREELSKRRIAGSSFAAREIASTEAQFAQEEDRVRAESFLQELDATNQLIGQEFQTSIETFDRIAQQLNLETSIAAEMSGLASQLLQSNLTAQAEARASSEAGAAEFLGTIIGAFAPT